jgi:DNA-binding response OmpR family regulator
MEEIWGPEADSDERTVDVHIKRLRERLHAFHEFEIVTIRGVGYKAEIKI